jgi:hypothetical protein
MCYGKLFPQKEKSTQRTWKKAAEKVNTGVNKIDYSLEFFKVCAVVELKKCNTVEISMCGSNNKSFPGW